ncbi:tRNA1(Val) (adenine(37)-N6)-methyltransferase [Mesomycoplasma neurolyticum]|uniref:DNA methylase n=1 Tax=Mesomycoplasma neurolyticum TaxID=2120 RepID=A0A449A4G1_9BACT|nr:tRNA1(Val) (adenine(37)-N6)-methyltransferase [Mesomycoplasma neurolyticum]VEU59170.1 DNA methylase [Mesomycoplasma neurolyticum]
MNKKNVVKNSLGYDSDLYIYQDKTMFNYSVDTILLGNFVSLNRKTKKILEIGTNNGALAIFVAERHKEIQIDAIEIQKKAIVLAKKNVELNKKEAQINLIQEDFNVFYKKHMKNQWKKYDTIICNPPFYKVANNMKRTSVSEELLIATHEIKLTLEQIIEGSSKIIQQKGYLAFVLPTERFVDCIFLLRKYNFEPKRVKMVFPRENEKSHLVLIEARFASGWGTSFETNIYLHPQDKNVHIYRDEVKKLYKPIKIK